MAGLVCIDASDAAAPELRGWGRYVRELIGALERIELPGGLELLPLAGPRRGPELVWEQAILPRELRRRGAALVHSPNCFLPLRRPCPGVVTIHDLAFEPHAVDFSLRTGLKYRGFTPRAARSAERVICVSEFTRRDVCERYAVEPEKVRVIPEAPALPLGHAEPPPDPYLLAVGDLRRKKNLVRLVEAFRRLRRAGLPHRLVLAGKDAGEGAKIRAAAGDEPVELTGYVSDERLDALMRGADLLVHPSLYEGFGFVVLEAMARGCPVAAARATALPETGGDAAVYFDPLDLEEMASAIGHALEPGVRRNLIEAGRRRVRAFSWHETAERTAAVYGELAG